MEPRRKPLSLHRAARFCFWMGLALLLAGSSCFPRDYLPKESDLTTAHFATAPAAAPDSLVVVSYNIKFARHIAQAIEDFRENPPLDRADLVLLQEMDPDSTRVLAAALGYDFVYFPASIHPQSDRYFGNAIASRWPIEEPYFVLLPNEGPLAGTQRIAVLARVEIAGREIWVASVHTSTIVTPHEQRMAQNRRILREVDERGGPVLVGGDFNTVTRQNRAQLRRGFRASGFRQARLPDGGTIRDPPWYTFGASPTLDHIFYRGFRLRRAGIATGALASDHYPIWAVFGFPPEPSE